MKTLQKYKIIVLTIFLILVFSITSSLLTCFLLRNNYSNTESTQSSKQNNPKNFDEKINYSEYPDHQKYIDEIYKDLSNNENFKGIRKDLMQIIEVGNFYDKDKLNALVAIYYPSYREEGDVFRPVDLFLLEKKDSHWSAYRQPLVSDLYVWNYVMPFDFRDMNGDGFKDILVMQSQGATGNSTYRLFLYKQDSQIWFNEVENFTDVVTPNFNNGIISSYGNCGSAGACFTSGEYKIDKNDKLIQLSEITQDEDLYQECSSNNDVRFLRQTYKFEGEKKILVEKNVWQLMI